jgi:hypothetical protein
MLANPFDKEYKKRFTVKIGQHLKVIAVDEIECFYSEIKGLTSTLLIIGIILLNRLWNFRTRARF